MADARRTTVAAIGGAVAGAALTLAAVATLGDDGPAVETATSTVASTAVRSDPVPTDVDLPPTAPPTSLEGQVEPDGVPSSPPTTPTDVAGGERTTDSSDDATGAQLDRHLYFWDPDTTRWAEVSQTHAGFTGRAVPVDWNRIEPIRGRRDFSTVTDLIDQADAEGSALLLRMRGLWTAPRQAWLNDLAPATFEFREPFVRPVNESVFPDFWSDSTVVDEIVDVVAELKPLIDYPDTPVEVFSPPWLGIWWDETMLRYIGAESPDAIWNREQLVAAGYTTEADIERHLEIIDRVAALGWEHVQISFPLNPWIELTASEPPTALTNMDQFAVIADHARDRLGDRLVWVNQSVRDIDPGGAMGWDLTCPDWASLCTYPYMLDDADTPRHLAIDLPGNLISEYAAVERAIDLYGATSVEVHWSEVDVFGGDITATMADTLLGRLLAAP